jgi:hypothetical protein
VLPVVVFAYKRPQLLARTLACLRAAGAERIYAFVEAPESEDDADAVAAVRRELAAIDWATASVVERERHLGWTASLQAGLDDVFQHEQRAAVIEEDVAVAPEFLAYAARALARYEDEPVVAGVTGLRLPFSRRSLRRYPYDALMLPRFFTWGWATWRRAWETFEFDVDALVARLRAEPVALEEGGADLPWMVRAGLVQRRVADPWDIGLSVQLLLERRLFVVPTWNMVEHLGAATGLHGPAPSYELRWETDHRPGAIEALRLPPPRVGARTLKAYHVFRENPRGWTARRLLPRPARRLLRRLRGTYDVFR